MGEPSREHLRAIIQTQTEIAASDLDLDSVMQLIASRGQELTGPAPASSSSPTATRWSTGSPTGEGLAEGLDDPAALHAAADSELLAAKDELYGR